MIIELLRFLSCIVKYNCLLQRLTQLEESDEQLCFTDVPYSCSVKKSIAFGEHDYIEEQLKVNDSYDPFLPYHALKSKGINCGK